jgi:hypothetical protein
VDDIRSDSGKRLTKALDRPDYLGYTLHISPDTPDNLDTLCEDSPAALGALSYIAFETRRLFEEMKPRSSQTFQPLPVSSLVEPEGYAGPPNRKEARAHSSGQVFDLDYSGLPPAEVECLRFVLDDLGWDGYLGFIEEGRDSLHIGPAPDTREFFSSVFEESLGARVAETGNQ